MLPTVLVLDGNAGLQALASLTLTNCGLNVRTLSSGKIAQEVIAKVSPQIIVCGHDLADGNALEICKSVKQKKAATKTGFILLAPLEEAKAIAPEAEISGVDEILIRPFRSEQLQAAVERVLQKLAAPKEKLQQHLVITSHRMLQRSLEKIFRKHGILCTICGSLEEVLRLPKSSQFALTLVDQNQAEDLYWFSAKQMGALVVFTDKDQTSFNVAKGTRLRLIPHPLSLHKLEEALSDLIPPRAESGPADGLSLEPRETALLAARISAAVYETLLNQSPLKRGNWKGAADLAHSEVIRVCKQLERLITAKSE